MAHKTKISVNAAAWRKVNREKIKAYNKSYYKNHQAEIKASHKSYYETNRDEVLEAQKVYGKTANGRKLKLKTKRKCAKKQIKLYPERIAARQAVHNEVRSGRLSRQPCVLCQNPKSEAHHHLGYEKEHWLNIQWLCRKHHRASHCASA